MKKILFLILFFASLASFGQVYDYQVQAADILQSDNYFVWKGDTIRKDSIAYLDNHIDSIRVKYINGQFSKWIANSEKIRQWIAIKEPIITAPSVPDPWNYFYNGNKQFTPLKLRHTQLRDLAWSSSGHTGTNNTIASFDSGGLATYTTNNSSNWNTAYSWGNHASSGYATQNWVSSNFDKYYYWGLYVNNTLKSNIASTYGVGFNQGEGLSISHVFSGGVDKVTTALDVMGLSTIVNPTTSYYIPVNGGAGHTKITLYTLSHCIGTTAGTADYLILRDNSGDAYAHNFILSSDRRLKKKIIDLPNTEWTNKIEFKQFQFKDDPKEKIRYGVIAQDIEKIAPKLVSTDEQGNKAVAYIDLLIAKIAELEKRIKILENESFKNR